MRDADSGELPRLSLAFDGETGVERCVAMVLAAERLGFSRVWFSENPFGRSVVPTLALCAQATERIGLGVGVFTPFSRHPLQIGAEAKALDDLCGGRFAVGIGSGATQAAHFGIEARPTTIMRDAVAILRATLTEKGVDHHGAALSAKGVILSGEPRSAVPVYVAAMGPRAVQLAAELGDGLLISDMCPPNYTRWAVELAATRRTAFDVTQIIPCSVDPDGASARRVAATDIGRTLLMLVDHLSGGFPAVISAIRDYSGIPGREFDAAMAQLRAGKPAADVLDARYVEAYAVAGTPEECVERLRVMRQSGVTEAALLPVGPVGADQLGLLAAAAEKAPTRKER
ncbi:LLM class flavin-dependent oxidoreductase [Streptomyces sp. NPDC051172]|uniref:LLM class flavin-dependent oxidoreductase n=1 Tax=Streptomyces sp. NPDC051172 TaxID=3155796 RepID=UPI003419F3B4